MTPAAQGRRMRTSLPEWCALTSVDSDNWNDAAVSNRRQPWEDGVTRLSSAAAYSTWSRRVARSPTLPATSGSAPRQSTPGGVRTKIDLGLVPGLTSAERAELAAAKRRIRELEAELEIHRRASELLAEHSDPKGGSRPSR